MFFTSDHGFYFGEHDYFGKAEWVHDPEAEVTEDSSLPDWLPESWLLTVERSPLYKELTNVPLIVRGPGLEPGRTQAMTTAPDIAPTIMDLVGLGGRAYDHDRRLVRRRSRRDQKDEHRPLVVSSWPLYFAKGEIITAVDSKARRIDDYMPLTVTTPERSLILGGPDDEPELYDLARDPQESENTWATQRRRRAARRAGPLLPRRRAYAGRVPVPPPRGGREVEGSQRERVIITARGGLQGPPRAGQHFGTLRLRLRLSASQLLLFGPRLAAHEAPPSRR